MNRRGFLTGMAGILAAGYSASVLPSGVIMPVKKLWVPDADIVTLSLITPYFYYMSGGLLIKETILYPYETKLALLTR